MPVPLPLAVIVSQTVLLVAVQLQPEGVVTATLPVPPVSLKDWVVGAIEKLQLTAVCVTVKVCPAMVSVPFRELVAVLAANE